MCHNAKYQLKAKLLGNVATLSPGETRLASTLNALPTATNRTWEYWTQRLERADCCRPISPRRVADPGQRHRAKHSHELWNCSGRTGGAR